ncbi:hypothetical protein N9N88_01695 [Candidatus Poseidoniaceae archaeon]|nr:hypothetical protein [Candidatus Poseidoniaceae archaeon]
MVLFIGSSIPFGGLVNLAGENAHGVAARGTGVDLTVTEVSFSYTTPGDEEQYRMFSSNYPVLGFNRPQSLYVTDAVVDVPIQLEALVENLGTASSGFIDVNIKVLHNEYALFEPINETLQLSSLAGGESNTVSKTFTPTYSGNHTLIVRATSTVSDDNVQNDAFGATMTVASLYFNCDNLNGWAAGTEWGLSTDTALSMGSSCHAGNGQSSSYSNNLASSLTTPVMDMSDAVSNPSRTNGLSFYYTGSAETNDRLKVQVKTAFGNWFDLATVQGTVDQSFIDGQDYRTFSVNDGGIMSPLIPVPQEHFHAQTQFRFLFESDATLTDIGYYFDELVIVYDQKVRAEEYALSSNGISTDGSVPGEWGAVRVEVVNDGNISDSILPQIIGLPAEWEVYYANPNGVSINEQSGVLLAPGESKLIDIKIKPDENATTGFQQMTFRGESSQYSDVNTTLPMQFQVMPDREPYILRPEVAPACPPGSSCPFSLEVQNRGDATDVFVLDLDTSNLGQGWNVNFGWTQSENVLVRPDTPVNVDFILTVPETAIPDSMYEFSLTATSQNTSTRSHTQDIDVSASMISDASVGMTQEQKNQIWEMDAGDSISIEFTIWNNASRQDIFSISIDHSNVGSWVIESPPTQAAVVNSQSSATFRIEVTSPTTAQAGDMAPSITPTITSQRSGMVFQGAEFDEISVRTVSDLRLTLIEAPIKLKPGVPTLLTVDVENNGNGPVEAILTTESIPESWSWWVRIDNMNHSGPIELSARYDNEYAVTLDIMILLPSEERAGEIHTLSFSVENSEGLPDIMNSDNVIEFDTITAAVRIPSLFANMTESTAAVGDSSSVSVTVKNIGNAVDDSFVVMASVSVSPPNDELMSFLSVGDSGASLPMGLYNPFVMAAGQEMVVKVDMIIPDSMQLNSRIVVSFEVIAGNNAENKPYELVHDVLILVDSQRVLNAELSQTMNGTTESGTGVPFWLNLTSTSSQDEIYNVEISKPQGWQIVCLGLLVNESGRNFEFEPGHISPKYEDIKCELHRLEGPLEGNLQFVVESEDGVLSWQDEQFYVFEQMETEQFEMNAEVLATSIAGFLFAAVILTLLLRKRSNRETEEMYDSHPKTIPVFETVELEQGPPISSPTPEPSPVPLLTGPEVPAEGLPAGWSMEQWQYYGQQYLDTKQ